MLKILVANSKGGCGKSTIATNLAAYYAQDGKNTVLVDTDRQGSSQRWCEKRAGFARPVLPVPGTRADWRTHIPKGTQRIVIDAPAAIRPQDVDAFLDDVDALVVPILPSRIDLEASEVFLAGIANLARIKRGKVAVGLVANQAQAMDGRLAAGNRGNPHISLSAGRAFARHAGLCAHDRIGQEHFRLSLRSHPLAPGRLGQAAALAEEAALGTATSTACFCIQAHRIFCENLPFRRRDQRL